jgi:arabinogalactan oligomer/maltooligosaccharide transport system permease protein
MKSYKLRRKAADGAIYVILALLSVLWLLPIAYLVLQSFRAESGAYTDYIIPKSFG